RTRRLELIDDRVERRDHLRGRAVHALSGHAESRAHEPVRVEELSVVGGDVGRTCEAPLPAERYTAGRRVATVISAALNDTERHRCVGDRAAMGTYGVPRVRDRHDAGSAGKTDRRLDADHAVGVRGTDDTAG